MAWYLWNGFSFKSCSSHYLVKLPDRRQLRSGEAELKMGKLSAPSHTAALTGKLVFEMGTHKWNESPCLKSIKYLRGQKVTKYKTVQRTVSSHCPCLLPCGPKVSVGWSDRFSIPLLVSIAKSEVFCFFLICNVSYRVTLWFTSNTDAEGYVDFLKLSSSILFTGLGYCRWLWGPVPHP